MFQRNNSDDTRPIIIVGLGPIGLATILECLKHDSKKRKVIVFTNRSEYTRKFVIKVDLEDLIYLQTLVGEAAINALSAKKKLIYDYDRMRHHEVVYLQTKDLEIMLDRVENKLGHQRLELINVERYPQKKPRWVNVHTHKMTLVDSRELDFSILVETDGPNRDLVKIVTERQALPIEFLPAQDAQIHEGHVVVNFQIPAYSCASEYRAHLPNGEDLIAVDRMPRQITDPLLFKELQKMGWKLKSLPEVRIFCVDDIIYVGGECPLDLKQFNHSHVDWMRAVLRFYLPKNYIDALSVARDSQGTGVGPFKTKLDEANYPVFKFPKYLAKSPGRLSTYMVIMGCSLRTSHYHTGSSALLGFREVKVFGKLLKSKQTKDDWHAFTVKLNELRDINRRRVNMFLGIRAQREGVVPKKVFYDVKDSRLNAAYQLFSIDPATLYVADPSVRMERFEAQFTYIMLGYRMHQAGFSPLNYSLLIAALITIFRPVFSEEGRLSLLLDSVILVIGTALHALYNPVTEARLTNAATLIREDLQVRNLRETTNYLPDCTSIVRDFGFSSSGLRTWVNLAYSSKQQDVSPTGVAIKTYHFYRFVVQPQSDNQATVDEVRYCKLVIEDNLHCRLVIPANLGLLAQHVRAKYGYTVANKNIVPNYKYSTYGLPFSDLEITNQRATWLMQKGKRTGKLTEDLIFLLNATTLPTTIGLIAKTFKDNDHDIDWFVRVLTEKITQYTNKVSNAPTRLFQSLNSSQGKNEFCRNDLAAPSNRK